MRPNELFALALAFAAAGLLLLAGLLVARLAAARRSARTLAHALDGRALQSAAAAGARGAQAGNAANAAQRGGAANASSVASVASGSHAPNASNAAHALNTSSSRGTSANVKRARGMKGLLERCADAGTRWLDTSVGRQVVAQEDRRLLEQCGFVDARARGLFLMARIAGAIMLPLVAGPIAHAHVDGPRYVLVVIVAFMCGVMAPKLVLRRRAAARRGAVVDELPMLVDLLRLLQGVGLSLDQSLQVMVNDFRGVLPVLASELEIAQGQFAAGRTREQSLSRLASSFDNEDLRAVVRLLIQVDRHGGAVQEPLKQFGDRLRETRRAMLRERIGRMAVKMTGVMILTLLPALMIVTAGPGVMSVSHSLKSMHR
ncbi:type II secretion system F family protein [Paraburkholderia graminis]|uniref:Type II secretion system protein n=1 Tax=Paraburkholderia graminis (strain ATCC 700544 / DSM 17151 / LMG 18924 / NCIMB 13744 / C4D1M) TaxID=396598 RepID=B1GBK4_PARG4|nr:type II secretion system F family protein [Paraburkholderia graminis]EDT06487.1 type II secretion system protein [Paraburkholderia graminis C4D1M]